MSLPSPSPQLSLTSPSPTPQLSLSPRRAQPEGTVGLSPEEQQRWARRLARHLAAATRTLARLFLVHSVPESLKVTVTPRGGHGGH